jgi:hypothetical protein
LQADRRNRVHGASTSPQELQTMNEPTESEIEQFLFNPTGEQMEAFLKFHKERLAKQGETHDFGETIWPDIEE